MGASENQKLNPAGASTSTPELTAAPPLYGTDKAASLDGKLQKHSYDDIARVSELSTAALHDLPNPDFSAIAVNIQAC